MDWRVCAFNAADIVCATLEINGIFYILKVMIKKGENTEAPDFFSHK